MSSFAFSTAQTIINEAAVEVGLSASSDVYASTDPNFIQLRGLLQSVGQDLWRMKSWTQLQQVYTFTTIADQARYDLPADFGWMLEQTGWNRSNQLPLGGPLSPQEWEFLKARLVGLTLSVLFRPINQQLWLFPDTDTPADFNIAFEYASRYWVIPSGTVATLGPWSNGLAVTSGQEYTNGGNIYSATSTGTTGDSGPTTTGTGISDGVVTWDYVSVWGAVSPTANGDSILFDPLLVKRALKLAWLKAKGFDTTTAQGDYDRTLEQVMAADSNAPVLSLNRTPWEEPLIGQQSVPFTGFGLP